MTKLGNFYLAERKSPSTFNKKYVFPTSENNTSEASDFAESHFSFWNNIFNNNNNNNILTFILFLKRS